MNKLEKRENWEFLGACPKNNCARRKEKRKGIFFGDEMMAMVVIQS